MKPVKFEQNFLSEALDLIRLQIPSELLSNTEWQSMNQFVGDLPGHAAAGWIGFEFHLSDPSRYADLALRATPGTPFATWIKKSHPNSKAAAALNAIAREGSTLAVTRDFILEIDRVKPGHLPEEFGLFYGNMRPGDIPDLEDYVCAAVEPMGRSVSSGARQLIRKVGDSLTEEAWLAFLGFMPGRTAPGIRLALAVQAADLESMLALIGWTGKLPSEAASLIADIIAERTESIVVLHCDILGNQLGPRIGIECSTGHWLTTTSANWHDTIDRLESLGWCLPQKAAGLRRRFSPKRYFLPSGSVVVRAGIAHLKFVVDAEGEVLVKAYMGAGFFDF